MTHLYIYIILKCVKNWPWWVQLSHKCMVSYHKVLLSGAGACDNTDRSCIFSALFAECTSHSRYLGTETCSSFETPSN